MGRNILKASSSLVKESERKSCYNKRKKSVLKKAYELSVLCDVDVCVIIYSPFDNNDKEPETLPPSRDQVLKVISRFQMRSLMEQEKNMLNPQEFAFQEIKKLNDQLNKVQRSNRLKEMARLVNHRIISGQWNRKLSLVDLEDIDSVLAYKLTDISERMKELEKEAMALAFTPASALIAPVMPSVLVQQHMENVSWASYVQPGFRNFGRENSARMPPMFNGTGRNPDLRGNF